jgi:hypothetical protein
MEHDLFGLALPSPAEASNETTNRYLGFAQTENRFPLFRIVL